MKEVRNPQSAIRIPRTAAIGVGSLGRHHARNYAELARQNRVEFVGVCDSSRETAEQIAAENGAGHFTDWRELIDKVDIVSIATPTETHFEIACAFLEKNIHVLVEKPIALTLAE
ncbi:MAG: Gfo/Idh/MocA family oxidoreductase, partial [Acidobacteria bacterium]|nr:Gfo/Idh/MocA family oxidoreductase [Acidobacteriota bacterium]